VLCPFEVAICLALGDGAYPGKFGGSLWKFLVLQQIAGQIESLGFLDIVGSGYLTCIYNLL